MNTLVDHLGRPILREVLQQELAGPSTMGVRSVLSDHPAQGLTPQKLANILLMAEQGDAESYLALAEEMEEKDLHYRSVLGTRKLQVAGLDLQVNSPTDTPADQKLTDFIRSFLETDVLQGALFDILDAVGKGYSVAEIMWDTSTPQWLPKQILWRDPRWFGFDPLEGQTIKLREDTGLLVDLAPAKFIAHKSKSKSGLPIRGGLARTAAWGYLFKNFDLKAWLIFAEVYGHPLRVGKYGAGASEKDKATLLRAVSNIAQDHAAIIPQNMIIEFIEAKSSGNTAVFKELAEYLDGQISKLVLGQTGTTDAAARVGTADAHERVRADIEASDAVQLETTINRDLIRPLIDLNFGVQKAYPHLHIYRPVQENIDSLVLNLEKLIPLGLKVEASVVRDKLGLPDPAEGAEVLGTQQPMQNEEKQPFAKSLHTTAPIATPADVADTFGAVDENEWELQLTPLVNPIVNLAKHCTNAEDFLARLPSLVHTQSTQQLTESLARAMFAARLAGELDAK